MHLRCTCIFSWHIDFIVHVYSLCPCPCRFSSSIAKSAIELAYAIFVNERDYPAEARRAAAERVCLPLMRQCSEGALKDFFAEHICQIMSMVDEKLVKVSSGVCGWMGCGCEGILHGLWCANVFHRICYCCLAVYTQNTLESQLVSKLCSFQFLEVLFSRLSLALVGSMDSKINQQYCKGDPKTGKELTQAVTKCVAFFFDQSTSNKWFLYYAWPSSVH